MSDGRTNGAATEGTIMTGWVWAMPSRELRRPEIGGMKHHAIRDLRDLRLGGSYGAGEPCYLTKRTGSRFPWVAVFTDGSVLGFTDEAARTSLRTERTTDGRPVRVEDFAANNAACIYATYQDSLRTVYHGD
jgi:hypothetical protein